MQFRRGMIARAMVLSTLGLTAWCGALQAAAVPTAGDPPAKIQAYVDGVMSDMSTATPDAKPSYRDDALRPFNGADPGFQYTYSVVLVTEFRKLLETTTDPLNALNAAIVVADPVVDGKANKDVVLCTALLNHKNAGVRYWAARGLVTTIPQVVPIPNAAANVMSALEKAAQNETSPLVLDGVYASLASAAASVPKASIAPIIAEGLSHQADLINSTGLSPTQSAAASDAMQVIIDQLSGGKLKPTDTEQTQLLTAASKLIVNAATADTKDKANSSTDAPSAYLASLIDQTNNLIHGVGGSNARGVDIDKANDAATQYINVVTAMRKLNAAFPSVPVPASM
jgi:hypothetical protein